MSRPTRASAAGRAYNDLRNRARREGRGTQELLQMYLLERFLYRLASSPWRDRLVLKGGALLAVWDLRRQTRDVDLQAVGVDGSEETVASIVREIAAVVVEADDGVHFDLDGLEIAAIREGGRYAGVRVRMPAGIATARLRFQLDVNFGDPILPEPTDFTYPSLRLEPFEVVGYPPPAVLSEKLITMIELGDANTRERDFGDVVRLSRRLPVAAEDLAAAIAATADFRGIEPEPIAAVIDDLATRRQDAWMRGRSRYGFTELPESFADVIDEVIAFADPVLTGRITTGAWDPASREWANH